MELVSTNCNIRLLHKHGKAFYLCRNYMDFGEEMSYCHLNQKMNLVVF